MFFILLIAVPILLCLLILTLAWGIHLMTRQHPRPDIAVALLVTSFTLFIFMGIIVSTSPEFDFIDRCGPNGVGGCGNGHQTPAQVRAEIRRDVFVAVAQCVVAPSILGVGLLLFSLRRGDQSNKSVVDSLPNTSLVLQ